MTSVRGTRVDGQQVKLAQLRKEKSADKERAELKKSLLKVTRQRADIAQQYAVRVFPHPASTRHLPSVNCAGCLITRRGSSASRLRIRPRRRNLASSTCRRAAASMHSRSCSKSSTANTKQRSPTSTLVCQRTSLAPVFSLSSHVLVYCPS